MSLIRRIVAARRHLFSWFGGLALSAKAGILTAAVVTMSAGVIIGVPYSPSYSSWLTPTVPLYETLQTPTPLAPSMVVAASGLSRSDSSPGRTTAQPSATSAPQLPQASQASQSPQPQAATTDSSGATVTTTRPVTTIAPAATTAPKEATTTRQATSALQNTASVY